MVIGVYFQNRKYITSFHAIIEVKLEEITERCYRPAQDPLIKDDKVFLTVNTLIKKNRTVVYEPTYLFLNG